MGPSRFWLIGSRSTAAAVQSRLLSVSEPAAGAAEPKSSGNIDAARPTVPVTAPQASVYRAKQCAAVAWQQPDRPFHPDPWTTPQAVPGRSAPGRAIAAMSSAPTGGPGCHWAPAPNEAENGGHLTIAAGVGAGTTSGSLQIRTICPVRGSSRDPPDRASHARGRRFETRRAHTVRGIRGRPANPHRTIRGTKRRLANVRSSVCGVTRGGSSIRPSVPQPIADVGRVHASARSGRKIGRPALCESRTRRHASGPSSDA